ncbi:Cu/Pi carrier [Perkinsus olseni]|uniref:Cu/Pi carrier n=1 Tax=Perkinsus olseni TaxID=32597 RepID=A0A7J6P7Q6_PEROL|nr:Cu/Pi carrier [Perkinsus olseni]
MSSTTAPAKKWNSRFAGAVPHTTDYYLKCLAGGALACGTTHTLMTPVDVVKVNMQVNPSKYRSLLSGLGTLTTEEGVRAGSPKGCCSYLHRVQFPRYVQIWLERSLQGPVQHPGRRRETLSSTAVSSGLPLLPVPSSSRTSFLCPWEMIKVKMQASPTGTFPLGLRGAWKEMAANKGVTGFPMGSLVPLWYRQIPYTMYKHIFTRPKDSYSKATQLGITFASGYIAGIACAIVSQPADNLVSQMAKAENQSKTFMEMAKAQGVKNLFLAGLGPRIVMIGTLTGLQWWIYDTWKSAMGFVLLFVSFLMSTTSSVAAANSLTAATNPPKWNSRYAGSVPHTLDYYWKCLLGGAVACGTTHTSMCPVDVVKVNMQIDPTKYTSLYQGWKSILHEEGLKGVTKGWSATCVGYTFQGMFKFGLNEVFKDIYNNMVGEENSVKYRGWIWAASGGSAEFFADLALTPWEMIKVKMQCSPTGTFPLKLKDAWHEMAAHKMETGFPYGSLKPVWYRQIPYTIVKFVGFEFAAEQFYKYIFTRPKETYSKATQLGITFLSGYVAGIGCALVSQPADNLVSQMAKPENFGKSFMEMAKQEGIKNLFLAGLGPRILMVGTLTALQWWIFDAWKTAMGLGTSGGGAVKKTDKAKTQ